MKQLFYEKKEQIERGNKLWQRLQKAYPQMQRNYVFIFPEDALEICDCVLQLLPEFVRCKEISLFYALGYSARVLEKMSCASAAECINIQLTRQEIQDIVAYYAFHQFYKRIVIADLDIPNGRSGSQIMGIKDISLMETVSVGILGI